MQKVDKNNLKYLGEDFQYKLVKTFIEEPKFFEKMEPLVNQNMFTEPSLRNIVRIMKDYMTEFSVTPDYGVIDMLLGNTNIDEIALQIDRERLKYIQNEVTLSGYEKVKELCEKFFKQQNMVKVANKILQIAGEGDLDKYEECLDQFEKVVEISTDEDLGITPLENLDEAFLAESVVSIPTGIPELDNELGGGLDKGKLGLVIGPTGFGKTTLMTAFAYNAAVSGKKVLQIIFEDDVIDIRRKYISRMLNVEAFKFRQKADKGGLTTEEREELKAQLYAMPEFNSVKDNILIKRFTPGAGTTASDIIAFIKKVINSGFKPDMVTIDYFEPIAHEKGGGNISEWAQEGVTMRKLEGAAKDLDVAIWIPSQGGRNSFTAEVVNLSMGGGSIKKQQIAQVVMSITRNLSDLSSSKATITILKNRAGRSGKTFSGIYFDNGTCQVSMSGVKQYDDMKKYHEYEQETNASETFAFARDNRMEEDEDEFLGDNF